MKRAGVTASSRTTRPFTLRRVSRMRSTVRTVRAIALPWSRSSTTRGASTEASSVPRCMVRCADEKPWPLQIPGHKNRYAHGEDAPGADLLEPLLRDDVPLQADRGSWILLAIRISPRGVAWSPRKTRVTAPCSGAGGSGTLLRGWRASSAGPNPRPAPGSRGRRWPNQSGCAAPADPAAGHRTRPCPAGRGSV